MEKNISLSTRRRWGIVGLFVIALGFWASETVAKELTASALFAFAVVVIVVGFFTWMIAYEARRAFRLGADWGEAAVHGLMQAFRTFVGIKLKDPPKY